MCLQYMILVTLLSDSSLIMELCTCSGPVENDRINCPAGTIPTTPQNDKLFCSALVFHSLFVPIGATSPSSDGRDASRPS